MRRELLVIDSGYVRPRFAAIFLRVEGEELALVETGTARSKEAVLAALDARGFRREQVRYVVVTHAHLDHAAGAAVLLEALPRALLLAHPRALRHLVDPSRLEASARQVYGDAEFERLYGFLRPVPAERARSLEEGESLPFGAGSLRALHTRGHAKHHLCLLDPAAEAIYTGDSFGLAYPELQEGGLFIFPTTSPTDFEGGEALRSVERIAGSGMGRAMLTHFGELRDLAGAAAALREALVFSMELAESARPLPEADREALILAGLRKRYAAELAKAPFLELDLGLNAAGLAWSLRGDGAARQG